MDPKHRVQLMRAYLNDLCERLDQGRPLPSPGRRWWKTVAPASLMTVGLAVAACSSSESSAQTPSEICNDGVDNNGDGLVDCADPECKLDAAPCVGYGAEYAAPC